MGIVIPRPPMRRRERRAIEAKLDKHQRIMRQLMDEGMDRETASKQALAIAANKAGGVLLPDNAKRV